MEMYQRQCQHLLEQDIHLKAGVQVQLQQAEALQEHQ